MMPGARNSSYELKQGSEQQAVIMVWRTAAALWLLGAFRRAGKLTAWMPAQASENQMMKRWHSLAGIDIFLIHPCATRLIHIPIE